MMKNKKARLFKLRLNGDFSSSISTMSRQLHELHHNCLFNTVELLNLCELGAGGGGSARGEVKMSP